MKLPFALLILITAVAYGADSAPIFTTSFEASEGYVAGERVAGWSTSPAAHVVASAAFHGAQSVVIEAAPSTALLARDFALPRNTPHLFIDLYVRPAAGTEPEASAFIELGVSAVGFRRTATGLQVLAFDGDGQEGGRWVALGSPKPADDWLRITFQHDYAQRHWDLFLDGELVRSGLGFFTLSNSLLSVGIFGGALDETLLDNVYIGAVPPVGVEIPPADALPPGTNSATRDEPANENRTAGLNHVKRPSLSTRGLGLATRPMTGLTQKREQKLKVKFEIYSVLE